MSASASQAWLYPLHDDRRRLGVKVGWLDADGRVLPLDGPDLRSGWWQMERDGRWTDGAASLALPPGTAVLEIEVVTTLEAYPAPPLAA